MKWLRLTLAVAALWLVTATALGCNTIKGMGRDIEEGGESVQDVATEAQQEMKN
ncbi:MAG: entericidin A/B family lipoprotein [Candidatus Hydrogenedentes bacterium]|nr:entericidin A/B family lipoprotein [Candidatus Hydrogenedentota bacterium]MBI3118577.1 entericidin A/B family lipoprotein [Candidatus Hydrogenedentota bacterium]